MHNNPEYHRGPCHVPTTEQRARVRQLVRETKEKMGVTPDNQTTRVYAEICYRDDLNTPVSTEQIIRLDRLDTEQIFRGEQCPTEREMLHMMLDEYLDKGARNGEGMFLVKPAHVDERKKS